MELFFLIGGILLIFAGILFQIKPQTHFVFNKSKEEGKIESNKYLEKLDKKKLLLIRLVWAIIMIIGIILIAMFIYTF